MTKQAFLNRLNELTGALAEQERARLAEYYSEMIDDRVEEGVSEEEAVAALGDPADIAAGCAAERPAAPEASSETVSGLRHLRVQVANADVAIQREPLDNGAAAQLRFSDPTRFAWRMEDDALVVEELVPEGGHRGLRWLMQMIGQSDLKATIALNDALAGDLVFSGKGSDLALTGVQIGGEARLHSASGDMKLARATFSGMLEVTSNSGDIRLDDLRAGDPLRVRTASGDIEASGLELSGELRLESASGSIELRDCQCGDMTINTASGDIEADRCRAGGTVIHTASGDVRMDEVETDPRLAVDTASGDIDLTRCIARQTRINAVSGDVELRLEPLPCGYDITANTVSGDVHFSEGCRGGSDDTQPKIAIKTVSGDISARLTR